VGSWALGPAFAGMTQKARQNDEGRAGKMGYFKSPASDASVSAAIVTCAG
jgi:hypothetical protein